MAAIVLAAGDGTRMLSQIPKVIHSLYGKPLICHVLEAVQEVGIERIVVVVGYRSDLVQDQIGPAVKTVVQRPLKGTAHAVQQALPRLAGFQGDIVVLYGDTPLLTAQTIRGLMETHHRERAACTLLTAFLKEPTGYGRVVRDETSRVVRIVEEADATPTERAIEEINVGAYCFKANALRESLKRIRPARNGEYYLTDTVAYLVKQGAPLASASTRSVGEFLGINTRADLARVQTVMRSRVLEKFMLGGVTIVDPYTTYIDGSALIGQDTVVYPHTVIEKGVRIGRRCHLGPFCRVGAGTILEDGVEVGNFVELAECRVGAKSRILHHSFITHAHIGRGVFVGVGTVTIGGNHRKAASARGSLTTALGPAASLSHPIRIGDRARMEGGTLILGPLQIPPGQVVKAGSTVGGR